MTELDRQKLIYDWNEAAPEETTTPQTILLDDETLRDGLQSPSARDPHLAEKLELVHLMDRLGISTADIGLPGAGERAREHILAIAQEMTGLSITPNVACRTVIGDIAPVVDIAQKTGQPVEVCAFIGSSPIRQYTEDWKFDNMLRLAHEAVKFCTDHDLPCLFVTEDTTRATPEQVRALYTTAIEAGAQRICLCDTCGHATPQGAHNLVSFAKQFVAESGVDIGIDWHGHRDRGLGLVNTLAALSAGATRVHACAMGVGERTGNTEMDLLLVNLRLMGWIENDLSALAEYCDLAARIIEIPRPNNYPVFGKDAFETATGVHAAAVVKAFKKNDTWLANRVYSGVPADMVGLEQVITVGPMSGKSNVIFYLKKRGIEPTQEAIDAVLELAKSSQHILDEKEILTTLGG